MTYQTIFKELYRENKRALQTFILLSLVLSFSVYLSGNSVFAIGSDDAEMIQSMSGRAATLILPFIKILLPGIDVSGGLAILATTSISFDLIPTDFFTAIGLSEQVKNCSFGLLDLWLVRFLSYAWFVASKLSRSNRLSYATGVVIEDIENKLGGVIAFMAATPELFTGFTSGETVQAAAGRQILSAQSSGNAMEAILCFLSMIALLFVYVVVRTFFFFISILSIPVCSLVGFSGATIESLKTLTVTILSLIALFHPTLFFALYIVLVVVAVLCFKKAYITVRYFKNIYVKPFFKKFTGYDADIPLIAKKIPKKVRNLTANENVIACLPVYLTKKHNVHPEAYRHSKWWLVITNCRQYLCKPQFRKADCHIIDLCHTPEQKLFIKKSIRFFEIFLVSGGEENLGKLFRKINKDLHFVYSKEYFYRYDELKQMTGYTDYTEYVSQIQNARKLSRKEIREEKRLQRLAEKEEKRLAKARN